MDLTESVLSENLDEIIRRSALRLEQERLHVAELQVGGAQRTSAKATLAVGMQALDKLKAYRARFDKLERQPLGTVVSWDGNKDKSIGAPKRPERHD